MDESASTQSAESAHHPPPSANGNLVSGDAPRVPFWRIVGTALVAALLISLIYTLVVPGFSGRAWSDALCASALLVAFGSALPFFMDTGRGVAMLGRLGRAAATGDDARDEQRRIWKDEHRKRERGITMTFALALAAFLIGLISVIASLW